MRRTAKSRDLPHLPPVEKIELTDKNRGRRLIAAAFFLALGAVALAYGFSLLMTGDSGWRQIETNSGQTDVSGEFVLFYNIGASGAAAGPENRALSNLYTEACRTAYQLFTADEEFEGIHNVAFINSHPNEELEVDAVLYNAFALMAEHGRRELYLGPVYNAYDDIFLAADDVYALEFDPYLDDTAAAFYAVLSSYASNPDMIDLELLEGSRLRLKVSDEYLSYARENELERFIDFSWMKNAFITDYLADTLLSGGFSLGTVSSFDGFSRSLTQGGISYSLNIFDRVGTAARQAAVLEYSSPTASVSLHSYPTNGMSAERMYTYASGEVRTLFLDVRDGRCRSALHDLTAYSETLSCAEILMELIPVYIADRFDAQAMAALSDNGLQSIWCEDGSICYTAEEISLSGLYEDDTVRYTLRPVQK